LLDNTVGVVVQRGCAKWSALVITNWLLILNTRAAWPNLAASFNEPYGFSGCPQHTIHFYLLLNNVLKIKTAAAAAAAAAGPAPAAAAAAL